MKKKLTFEESMKKLQSIVEKLESGNESLESSLKLFEDGNAIAVNCYKTLKKAEQKIIDIGELEENINENLED